MDEVPRGWFRFPRELFADPRIRALPARGPYLYYGCIAMACRTPGEHFGCLCTPDGKPLSIRQRARFVGMVHSAVSDADKLLLAAGLLETTDTGLLRVVGYERFGGKTVRSNERQVFATANTCEDSGESEKPPTKRPITDPFGPWRMLARDFISAFPAQARWGEQATETSLREWEKFGKTVEDLRQQIGRLKVAGITRCSPRELYAMEPDERSSVEAVYGSPDEIAAEIRRQRGS